MDMQNTMSEGFWNFSIRVYRKPDVSQCGLSLQDLYGLDVNLLLFACWHARSSGLCELALVEKALAFSSNWADHVVKPLRGARRWMKTQTQRQTQTENNLAKDFHSLREQIKTLELQCEKFQQNTLESLVSRRGLSLSVEMQIASAAYNLHYILLSAANPQPLSLSLPLRDLLITLILSALDQDPDDDALQQVVSRELNAQSSGAPGVRICESLPSA